MEAHYVLKRPLLSEKTTFAANEHNRHAFVVDRRATKDDIKRAVEEIYKVRVIGVNTVNRRSRDRRYRYGSVSGKVMKKAIVRVHEDDTLDII